MNGYRWLYKGRWRKALPLPWYARLRLWGVRQIDTAAYWLTCGGHCDAARRLYEVTGLWNASRKP